MVGREQVRSRKCMGREKVSREKTNTLVVNSCDNYLFHSTAEEMRESGKTFQSLIVWGKKFFL